MNEMEKREMTVSWDWVTTNNEVNTAHYELFPKDNIQ
jgi:hypothetical protein